MLKGLLALHTGAVFELQAGTYSRRRNPLMLAGRYVHNISIKRAHGVFRMISKMEALQRMRLHRGDITPVRDE